MSSVREQTGDDGAMLHPELRAEDDPDAIIRGGRRLDHAEGASKPLRARPEPQPRGAKVHGNGQSTRQRPLGASSPPRARENA